MSLVIEDFRGRYQAENVGELEAILSKRYGPGVNGFWLSHDNEKNPSIALLARGELAVLHYFSREGHPGFVSVGRIPYLDRDGFTKFSIDAVEQESEFMNSQVVTMTTALSAARDFLASKELPGSIEWTEL